MSTLTRRTEAADAPILAQLAALKALRAAMEAKGQEIAALDAAIAALPPERVPQSLTELHTRACNEHDAMGGNFANDSLNLLDMRPKTLAGLVALIEIAAFREDLLTWDFQPIPSTGNSDGRCFDLLSILEAAKGLAS